MTNESINDKSKRRFVFDLDLKDLFGFCHLGFGFYLYALSN